MAYFPHAYEKLLVGTAGIPVAKKTQKTTALAAGEVQVINAKTNVIVDLAAAPTYAATPMVYLAQGSFHANDKIGPFHGGYQETVKSKGINPKYVSKFYVAAPAEPVAQKIAVGCENVVSFVCNKTYRLRIDVKGAAALRFLTHNLYHTFDAATGCCPVGSTTATVDPAIIFEGWALQIASDPIMKSYLLPTVKYYTLDGAGVVTAQANKPANWGTFANDKKFCKLEILVAYVDTKFGNASFDPKDYFDIEPLRVYASVVDESGDPCAATLFCVAELVEAKQGNGYGETLVRSLILQKAYQQEPFQQDNRLKEVLDDTTLTEINRNNKYFTYNILHSVPRNSNPSGMMDADQYLIRIVVNARVTAFETYLNTLLSSAGSAVQLEVM